MIRSLLLTSLTLSVLAAAPAAARDSRLVAHRYNAEEVVRIPGRAGVQTTIAFADDEHIENVAIGDSNSWQVTPNKRANLLFVKPLNARARTNLTVVTDRRRYFFDLLAAPGQHALYVLRFTYPDEPKQAARKELAGSLNEEEARAISEKPLPVPPPAGPAALNFAWTSKGDRNLIPARIYDDGTATFLAWNPGTPIPAFLVRDEKGDEGPVNFAVRGDVIVIDGVPGTIVLRSGKNTATLQNKGPARKVAPAPELAIAPAPAQSDALPVPSLPGANRQSASVPIANSGGE
jgi:type IV secretion system protein VirB9